MKRTRLSLPLAVLATSLVLAACGSDDTTSESAPSDNPASDDSASDDARADGADPDTDDAAEHNAADVAFARDMIPHHEQAVEMAELAEAADAGQEVAELAEEIRAAQAPEIELMSAWLAAWGEPVPGESDRDHDGHEDHDEAAGHGGHGSHDDMPGMLDDEQLAELADAAGDDFDRLFLELMIEHHEGAVTMAEEQLDEGVNHPAHELSEEIIKVQKEEIDLMKGLLDG